MPLTLEPIGTDVAADALAAAIAYATTHYEDPAGTGGSRSDSGAQACTATNVDGTITLDAVEHFTGTPGAAVTHVGLWDGDPSSGGHLLLSATNDKIPAYNPSGQTDLTGFTIVIAS